MLDFYFLSIAMASDVLRSLSEAPRKVAEYNKSATFSTDECPGLFSGKKKLVFGQVAKGTQRASFCGWLACDRGVVKFVDGNGKWHPIADQEEFVTPSGIGLSLQKNGAHQRVSVRSKVSGEIFVCDVVDVRREDLEVFGSENLLHKYRFHLLIAVVLAGGVLFASRSPGCDNEPAAPAAQTGSD